MGRVDSRYELSRSELSALLGDEPPWRVGQVWDGLYRRVVDPSEMTELPRRLRCQLADEPALAPALYRGVTLQLRHARPSQQSSMLSLSESWPQENEAAEESLRTELQQLDNATLADARTAERLRVDPAA